MDYEGELPDIKVSPDAIRAANLIRAGGRVVHLERMPMVYAVWTSQSPWWDRVDRVTLGAAGLKYWTAPNPGGGGAELPRPSDLIEIEIPNEFLSYVILRGRG